MGREEEAAAAAVLAALPGRALVKGTGGLWGFGDSAAAACGVPLGCSSGSTGEESLQTSQLVAKAVTSASLGLEILFCG